VRAHTGGEDDLSKQNDIVDRMARESVEGKRIELPPARPENELFEGCPLGLMSPSVSTDVLTTWIRENLSKLDTEVINKHLFKAFTEMCKTRNVTLTKSTVQKQSMVRAELTTVQIEKIE
jgi:hypothetical protein